MAEQGSGPSGVAQWDEETDVVVVGFGFAGGATAIAAHDAGAEVVLVEKMAHPGGISVCSAGELGSIFGHLYIGGGNLSECFVGGRAAGRAVAAEAPLT